MRNLTLGSLLLALCPAGVLAGDGVVALQTAEASCGDRSTAIYVECGNGTVTDNRTGLVWLKNADCLGGGVSWYSAMTFVAGLSDHPGHSVDDCGLRDGSSPGEWRLPSLAEWEAMVADAIDLGCEPRITNDQGTSCWSAECNTIGRCVFSDVQSASYWSSSSRVSIPTNAWHFNMSGAFGAGSIAKSSERSVWPVRGGQ